MCIRDSRVALAVSPKKNLVFRGAWGIYHQPVDLMSLPIEDSIKTVGRAEQATHYILGCEYSRGNNFLIRFEGYYKKFDNLVGRLREFGRQTQIFKFFIVSFKTNQKIRKANTDFHLARIR